MTFRLGQRVILDKHGYAGLRGRTATVVRLLRRSTDEAWVNVEGDPIPATCAVFPPDDPDGRGNHVCIYGDECTEIA
jgi:hypothetical protein